MSGLIDKLIVERDELFERLKKLSLFLDMIREDGVNFPEVREEQLELLYIQEEAMLTYYAVLVARIEDLEKSCNE